MVSVYFNEKLKSANENRKQWIQLKRLFFHRLSHTHCGTEIVRTESIRVDYQTLTTRISLTLTSFFSLCLALSCDYCMIFFAYFILLLYYFTVNFCYLCSCPMVFMFVCPIHVKAVKRFVSKVLCPQLGCKSVVFSSCFSWVSVCVCYFFHFLLFYTLQCTPIESLHEKEFHNVSSCRDRDCHLSDWELLWFH